MLSGDSSKASSLPSRGPLGTTTLKIMKPSIHVQANKFQKGHINHSLVSIGLGGLAEGPLARWSGVASNGLAILRWPFKRQRVSSVDYGISSI